MKKTSHYWLPMLFAIAAVVLSCQSPNATKSDRDAARRDENLTYVAFVKGEATEEIFRVAREVKAVLAKHGIDIVMEGGLGIYDISVKSQDASRAIKILKAEPSLQRSGLEIVQK